jgi:hypothetical protein
MHSSTVLRPSTKALSAVAQLSSELKAGKVYRREDLARLSKAVDRHIRELVDGGQVLKLAQGLYYVPKQSKFGPLPPEDDQLVEGFLRDKEFLVFSPSAYNTVGLGTTQLYNRTLVYNHKRHGVFQFGKRQFDFRVKPRFPKELTQEFLYVDLLNNLDELAEDRKAVLEQARLKLPHLDTMLLKRAAKSFGNLATRKRLREWADG